MEVKTVIVDPSLTVKGAVRLLDDKRYLILRTPDGREITQDELYIIIAERGIYDGVFDCPAQ